MKEPLEDLLDVQQYAVTHAADLSADSKSEKRDDSQSHRNSDVDPSFRVKQELDKLINADIAAASAVQMRTIPAPAAYKAPARSVAKPVAKASRHVVDLRKHFLIQKYELDTIKRPPRRLRETAAEWLNSFERPVKQSVPVVPRRHFRLYAPSMGGVASFLFVLAIVCIPAAIAPNLPDIGRRLTAFTSHALTAVSDFRQGIESIQSGSFESSEDHFTAASDGFRDFGASLRMYNETLLRAASYAPFIGKHITLAQSVATIGVDTSEVFRLLSQSLAGSSSSPYPTDTLRAIRERAASIASTLSRAAPAIASINPEQFGEWTDEVAYLQEQSGQIINDANDVTRILDLAHSLLGGDGLRRYLVIFQNSRELRPTGGFIGTYAVIDVNKGAVTVVDMPGGGVYDLTASIKDSPAPPEPIRLVNDKWFFWDANWWVDYPTSAQKIRSMFESSYGASIDGVIAVNSDVMVDLLRLTGPIEMPEYGTSLSADTFYAETQQEVELAYDKDLNQPKKILVDAFPLLLERLLNEVPAQDVVATMVSALSKKDIQLYSEDTNLQSTIRSLRWAGELRTAPYDYLQVVSTNIAGGKSDHAIYQTIDHAANVSDDGTVRVSVTVTKDHQGTPDDIFSYVNNVDYMRFYLPLGSTIRSATGFTHEAEDLYKETATGSYDTDLLKVSGIVRTDPVLGIQLNEELGKRVAGGWMIVAPGEQASVTITYDLPFRIAVSEDLGLFSSGSASTAPYSFIIQRQPGKINTIINSRLTLPETMDFAWFGSSPGTYSGAEEQSLTFSGTLDHDIQYAALTRIRTLD